MMETDFQTLEFIRIRKVLDIRSPADAEDQPEARVLIANSIGSAGLRISKRELCRKLLGILLDETCPKLARRVRLVHTNEGAPRLMEFNRSSGISVSLSHSGDDLMAAICRNAHIGIDLEKHAPRRRSAEIASYLGWDADDGNKPDFLARWTLWEASAKCLESSVLMSENPGFKALDGKLESGQLGAWGAWHGLTGRTAEMLSYSVALFSEPPCRLELSTPEFQALHPWKHDSA